MNYAPEGIVLIFRGQKKKLLAMAESDDLEALE